MEDVASDQKQGTPLHHMLSAKTSAVALLMPLSPSKALPSTLQQQHAIVGTGDEP